MEIPMSTTIQCHSCGVALHIGDAHNEDGCPCCGGEINSPKVKQVQLELKQIAKEQNAKEVF